MHLEDDISQEGFLSNLEFKKIQRQIETRIANALF